jgi:hypothetical protein
MAHIKGTPKTGGRQPGSANKVTAEMKSLINDFLHEQWPKFGNDFNCLEPADRIKFFITLLDYVTPKLTKTEAKVNARNEPALDLTKLTPEQQQELYSLLDKTGWVDPDDQVTAIAYIVPDEAG